MWTTGERLTPRVERAMRSAVEYRDHEILENQDVGRWSRVHGGGIDPVLRRLRGSGGAYRYG